MQNIPSGKSNSNLSKLARNAKLSEIFSKQFTRAADNPWVPVPNRQQYPSITLSSQGDLYLDVGQRREGALFLLERAQTSERVAKEVPMKTKFALSADDKAHLRKLRENRIAIHNTLSGRNDPSDKSSGKSAKNAKQSKDWFAQRDGEQAKLIKKVSDIDFGLAMLSAYSDATKRTVSINVLAHRTKDKDLPTLAMEIPLIQYVSALGEGESPNAQREVLQDSPDFDDVKVVSMFWAMDSR